MKRGLGWCATAALAIALFGAAPRAHAYDNDTHYFFTYYLAIQAGYTPDEARRVASADVSIDLDPNTEPMQGLSADDHAQDVRINFHAFLDYRLKPNPNSERPQISPEADKEKHRAWLEGLSTRNGNIGEYLHYTQDSYAHAGFWSAYGHGMYGHEPDFLSHSEKQAKKMARSTITILTMFRKDQTGVDAPPIDYDKIDTVLHDLVEANPYPSTAHSPDQEKARKVIAKALGTTVPDWIVYHYDIGGNPVDKGWKVFKDQARTLTPVTDLAGSYSLAPRHATGKRLDVYHERSGNGTYVQLYAANSTAAQSWKFTRIDSNIYRISPSYATDKALDVDNGGGSGTTVHLWDSNGKDTQKWAVYEDTNGGYDIVSVCNNGTTALSLEGGSADDGAKAIVYSWSAQTGTWDQSWILTYL